MVSVMQSQSLLVHKLCTERYCKFLSKAGFNAKVSCKRNAEAVIDNFKAVMTKPHRFILILSWLGWAQS